MEISPELKKELLSFVRKTIEYQLFKKEKPVLSSQDSLLEQFIGVFVTLHKKEDLRGCIGNIQGVYPLKKGLEKMALAAAFEDPRFPPLRKEEWQDIKLEITLLSPLKKCHWQDIIPFEHGVVLTNGYRKSVYLPQVWEQLPNKEIFLASLCQKGGMPGDCYKDPNTIVEVFTAYIISE